MISTVQKATRKPRTATQPAAPGRVTPNRPDPEGAPVMPITFRKSFRIFPGVRLNLNAKSWSVTVGPKNGPKRTWSSTGRTTTSMDLPGPLGYRSTHTRRR